MFFLFTSFRKFNETADILSSGSRVYQQILFKYGDDIFYDNGETKTNAKNRIPSNYKKKYCQWKNKN